MKKEVIVCRNEGTQKQLGAEWVPPLWAPSQKGAQITFRGENRTWWLTLTVKEGSPRSQHTWPPTKHVCLTSRAVINTKLHFDLLFVESKFRAEAVNSYVNFGQFQKVPENRNSKKVSGIILMLWALLARLQFFNSKFRLFSKPKVSKRMNSAFLQICR